MIDVQPHLLKLNDLLSESIAIQKNVFGGSIRRAIPISGIFKRINFGRNAEKLGAIGMELEHTTEICATVSDDDPRVQLAL